MNIADHSATNIICNKYSHNTMYYEDYSNLPRPYYTFAYILEGTLDCICEAETVHAQKGDILFVPYKIKYRLNWSTPNTTIYSCHFNFPDFSVPFGNKTFPLQKILKQENLQNKFEFLYEHSHHETAVLRTLAVFYQICDTLFPYLKYTAEHHIDYKIRKAVDYIQQNFRSPISIDELANLCGYSVSHFHYTFKKEIGIPAIEFKNTLCIRHAALLLLDDHDYTIEQISSECGFSTAEYFRRVFKAFMGVSPREYRNSMKKTI